MTSKDVPLLHRADVIAAYAPADRAAPHLRLGFIASIDGAATREGVSGGLGNADDRLVFETLRMLCDVILVGAGTVRAEGYGGVRVDEESVAWRVENGLSPQPRLALVTSRLDFDPRHPFFEGAAERPEALRPIVVTTSASDPAMRAAFADVADVVVCGETGVDPALMVASLHAAGLTQLHCEGGPSLFGSLIAADLVDELCLTVSPVLDGGDSGRISAGSAATPRPMRLLHATPAGSMLFLRYERDRGAPQ
ncbi:MAG: pyrimidine reductase family protein [Burkholderiaceae bacterium]|nr:pyrimidine reductase family protein [Microbacteriaceae bacterium]